MQARWWGTKGGTKSSKGCGCRLPAVVVAEAARGNSSVGRAQPCQGWGRGFESRFPLSICWRRAVRAIAVENGSGFGPLPFLLSASRHKLREYDGPGGRHPAGVAKSVDARDLKSCGGNPIRVRFPVPA